MKIIDDDIKVAHRRIQAYMQGFFTIHKGRLHRLDFIGFHILYYLIALVLYMFLKECVFAPIFDGLNISEPVRESLMRVRYDGVFANSKLSFIQYSVSILALIYFYVNFCLVLKRLRDIGMKFGGTITLFFAIAIILYYAQHSDALMILFKAMCLLALCLWLPQERDNENGPYDEISYSNYRWVLNKERKNKSITS